MTQKKVWKEWKRNWGNLLIYKYLYLFILYNNYERATDSSE